MNDYNDYERELQQGVAITPAVAALIEAESKRIAAAKRNKQALLATPVPRSTARSEPANANTIKQNDDYIPPLEPTEPKLTAEEVINKNRELSLMYRRRRNAFGRGNILHGATMQSVCSNPNGLGSVDIYASSRK